MWIWTRSSLSRLFGRLAKTTRLELTAWCFKLRSRRDVARAQGLRCRSVATSTVGTPFGGELSSWAPTMRPDGFIPPRPRNRRARMPQDRRSGLGSTLGSSPRSALTGLRGVESVLECRPPVAFGSLRPALLHRWPRRPSESGQITCQNRADISLVFNRSRAQQSPAEPSRW
jgi:hypothetical protein